MSIHTKALKQACAELSIPFSLVGKSGVFLTVQIHEKPYYFLANQVPLNNSMVVSIVEDKGHTYDLLSSVIQMPKTVAYLDPNSRDIYQPYVTFQSLEDIAEDCIQTFGFPHILKKNSGSQGANVYRCENKHQTISALQTIFDPKSVLYDHVALAQECIDIDKEYRVTVLNKNVEIIYLKDNSEAQFVGNLSPLHWEGSRAVLIEDQLFKKKITEFIQPIFSKLDLKYGGLDIAIDKNGKLWLFEINSQPAYDHLVLHTNIEILINLYKKILQLLSTL